MSPFLKKIAGPLVLIALVVAAVVIGISLFNKPHVKTKDEYRQAGPTEIVLVTPENIDCRAYERSDIALKGESQTILHTWIGSKTLNTDTIWINAIGDVEYCLPTDATTVSVDEKGVQHVRIDASRVQLNRPRVDMTATALSVRYEEGAGRTILKFVPLVNFFVDTNAHELTVEGLSFAQSVIGSSECMKAGWEPAKQAFIMAYQAQAADKQIAADKMVVEFTGVPNYTQYAKPIDTSMFGRDVKFSFGDGGVKCQVLADALQTAAPDTVTSTT